MPLTNYSLDNFVAPKLSELQRCGAEPLPEPCDFLRRFILESILNRSYSDNARAMLFNLIRRVGQAYYEYEQGRTNLRAHIEEPRLDHLALYFHALAHFEQCLAAFYQAATFWRMAQPNKTLFVSNDGSMLDRTNKIYNVSHHLGEAIANDLQTGVLKNETTRVWLLNEGIAIAGVVVEFAELRQELIEMRESVRRIVEGN